MNFITRARKLLANSPKEIIKRTIKKLLLGKGVNFFELFGLHVLPIHYYSPMPSIKELKKKVKQWYKEGSFTGIDFNIKEEKSLLEELVNFNKELESLDSYESIDKQCFGEGYGETESQILYAMIRNFKPRTIIEVGSGVSTFFSSQALDTNKKKDNRDSRLICIEPYPWQRLNELNNNGQIEIIKKPVQEIDKDFFKTLKEGDFLFIDSSHMVKIGSDVNYLYLEILPNLNKGVIIHIHDIFFPYPALNSSLKMLGEYRLWTEQALVQAFLTYNNAFKILLCSSYLHYKMPDVLKKTFSAYDPKKHLPSSLWLQKLT